MAGAAGCGLAAVAAAACSDAWQSGWARGGTGGARGAVRRVRSGQGGRPAGWSAAGRARADATP